MADKIEPSELEGAMVLAGLTKVHSDGSVTQEQYAGTATIENRANYCLVVLSCSDGKVRDYPFDSRTLARAAPGQYSLRSTGEMIENPDFLMTWHVTLPKDAD